MLASASFGLIPLFTLPMMQEGLQTDSILTYRMFLASALVAVLMLLRGMSFAMRWRELPWFAFLGFFYYGSAALLFQGYHSMSSGMATTLHFLYPIGVTLIMRLVFGQRTSPYTILAIGLALSGVALLSLKGDVGMGSSPLAFALVLLSGFSYAIYLVAINNVQLLRAMDNLKLTLYSLLFGGIYFLVDTLLSNLCLVRAIKSIGSTLTSVLGAMEPLTAIVIGVLVLGELVTPVMLTGVLLIVSAVTIIVLSPLLDRTISPSAYAASPAAARSLSRAASYGAASPYSLAIEGTDQSQRSPHLGEGLLMDIPQAAEGRPSRV